MSARMVQRVLKGHGAVSSTSAVSSEIDHSDSDEDFVHGSAVTNRFDLLGLQEEDVENENEDESQRQSDQQNVSCAASTSASESVKARKKKNKSKKKGKQQQQSSSDEKIHGADVESVDQLLSMLGERNDEASSSTRDGSSAGRRMPDAYDKHLGADMKHLRAEDELRRIFGSKVINSVESGFQRRRQGASRRTGRGMPWRRSVLVVPMEHWARWDGGISMECTEVKDGRQYFRYGYSSSYAEVQKKFELCVRSHNPNTIVALLRNHPYHVDSLLALAEVYKHMGEYQQAADLLEQCLYALECAWHPSFNPSLGTCRLDYTVDTNRAFFLALFRHMQQLGKRGCHCTALEICKFLLSLDSRDPYGALFCIDYFALRAEQYQWLVKFVEYSNDKTLHLLPSFSYSLAIAWFHMEKDKSEATQRTQASLKHDFRESKPRAFELLQQALAIHPTVLKKIVDRVPIKGDAEWNEILNHPHFLMATGGGPTLEHLINIYIERNYLLWRVPELQAWLKAAAASLTVLAKKGSPDMAKWGSVRGEVFHAKDNQYQHLQLSEFSDSTSSLPIEELPPLGLPAGFGPEGEFHEDDPFELPALQDAQNIPEALQDAASQGRNALLVFLQSLVPWMERAAGGVDDGPPVLLDDSSDNNDSTTGEFGDESPM
ncbi:hypothetical protein R1sor_018052 [Riccia sorocarpa]|uniref:Transcription factor 25 n=1 Tax=Riccia sorocarpa TaxID=122646 RepID=A0ABD3IC61_9MARC